jgi:DnaJ-class molecular chaperone
MAAGDPYKLLGVGHEADPEAIKRAYRRLVLALHPDSADRFRAVREAYELLSDPMRRRLYDQRSARERIRPSRAAKTAPPLRRRAPFDAVGGSFSHPTPLDEFLDHFISDAVGFAPASATPARTLRMEVVLSPEEALTGVRLPIDVPIVGERIWLDIAPGVRGGERRQVQVAGAEVDLVLDIRVEVD